MSSPWAPSSSEVGAGAAGGWDARFVSWPTWSAASCSESREKSEVPLVWETIDGLKRVDAFGESSFLDNRLGFILNTGLLRAWDALASGLATIWIGF